mgnify:CR=1 FL=1
MTKNKLTTTPLLTLALTGVLLTACSGGGKESKPRPSDPTAAAKYDIDRKYEHYTALAESIEKALIDDNIDGDEVETISGHYRDYEAEIGNILRRAKKNDVYKNDVYKYQEDHTMNGVISWQQDIESPLKENNVYGLAIRKTQMDMLKEDPEKFGFLKDDL